MYAFVPEPEEAHAEEHAEVPYEEVLLEVVYTEEGIKQLIRDKANKYGVSYEKMNVTVACESGYKADIQSRHTLSYGREQSWGVAQFHIPSGNRNADGKVMTKEMAIDPEQALDAMAYHFSIGNARLWTCYRTHYTI